MLQAVRNWVEPALCSDTGRYWIVDDTGFPKKGKHSVGVARQYCSQRRKQDNCQVADRLSLAAEPGSIPIAYQLCLPKDWVSDTGRRLKGGVLEDHVFATKPQIALAQLRRPPCRGAPGVVSADAGYGDETAFRDDITALGLLYTVGICPGTTVWPPGALSLPPRPPSGRGHRSSLLRRGPGHEPVAVKDFAMRLPPAAFQQVH